MALHENVAGCVSLPASTDLSTKQYYAVKLDSNGQVALAGAGECAIGILYSKPSAQGTIASVRPLDGRKALGFAGGTIAKGALVAADANGKFVTATKGSTDTSDAGSGTDALVGSHVLGVAIESAVSGDIFQILALALGAVPTTAA